VKVLGIDPGTATCGYGIVHGSGGRLRAVGSGCWRTSARERLDVRLLTIFEGVRELIAAHEPDAVALEESYVGADARIALSVGQARGAVLVAAAEAGVECAEHAPARVKQTVCGYGRADKEQMQRMVKLKHEQKGAPVYQYYFTWQSPMLEDAGAWHTAELAFCFDNTKRAEQGTGNTPEAQKLAKEMADAWAAFARTGNPSHGGLTWAPFEPERCPTMVFDNVCGMQDDPESANCAAVIQWINPTCPPPPEFALR